MTSTSDERTTTAEISLQHEGEQTVQRRAGEHRPGRGSPMFGPDLRPEFLELITAQQLAVLGGSDDRGRMWATILTARDTLVRHVEENTLWFDSVPVVGDPLHDAFADENRCGTLFIDTVAPRRVRINGRMRRYGDGLVLHSEQAFRNCTKYIHRRELVGWSVGPVARAFHGSALTRAQREWIADSDTFFVASRSASHGADVNHRGGPAGFVSVVDPRRIRWPDYRGNNFYMTFGNLELDHACGLCFLDWERGRTLHLSGTARVDWGPDPHDHAHRFVHFEIEQIVEIHDTTPLRWRSLDRPAPRPQPQEGRP